MNDQERLDDLIIDGLQIYQRSDMFRFSFDAIALIHFCRFNGRHTYVDLGTGSGVMPLIGTSLGAGHITGIEINETLVELAKRSVEHNRKQDVVNILCGDYRHMTYKISLLMVLLLIPLFMIVKAVQSLHLKSVI